MRVRFAPSPTGFLHIGGARTALFNWMYARSQGGQFILRIEDTDGERSRKEYLDEILESMRWLGLTWDALHKQSDRFAIYREHAEKLLAEGKAYKEKSAEGSTEALILKMPQMELKFYDLIRDAISFDAAEIKDQVLIKSDGSPAYNFACVVDDALMGITCVIRGEDHISNTPKQLAIYHALGFKPPKFAHLPLILSEEGGRMSKRHGAAAVTDYRKMGFLPEAIVNYLMLLGWSPGNNQEIVPLANAVKNFSIKKINKAAAMFSMEKLEWINAQYLKRLEPGVLTDRLMPFLKEKGFADDQFDRKKLEVIAGLFKGRLTRLTDFLDWADFIFIDEIKIDEEIRAKYLVPQAAKEFQRLAERLKATEPFDAASAEAAFRGLVAELGIKAADLVHPVRVALTGKTIGPGLFETMAVLGKEKTIKRLAQAVKQGRSLCDP